jgi:antitoxin component YwqK of YwqJK toxin-antitoxin module
MKTIFYLLFFIFFISCKSAKNDSEIVDINTHVEYFENGKVKSVGNVFIEKSDSLTYKYFKDSYKPRIGFWNEFYENGKLKASGNYKLDTYRECGVVPFDVNYSYKIGEWIYFYDNGNLKAKGIYRIGKKNRKTNCEGGYDIKVGYVTGDWKFYDKNGKEIKPTINDIKEIEESSYISEWDMLYK